MCRSSHQPRPISRQRLVVLGCDDTAATVGEGRKSAGLNSLAQGSPQSEALWHIVSTRRNKIISCVQLKQPPRPSSPSLGCAWLCLATTPASWRARQPSCVSDCTLLSVRQQTSSQLGWGGSKLHEFVDQCVCQAASVAVVLFDAPLGRGSAFVTLMRFDFQPRRQTRRTHGWMAGRTKTGCHQQCHRQPPRGAPTVVRVLASAKRQSTSSLQVYQKAFVLQLHL